MSDGQEYLMCPFNESHMILTHRMPKHILQCKKNYPTSSLVVCPFNNIHYFTPNDMETHKLLCPDRSKVERIIYQNGPQPNSIDDLIPVAMAPSLDDDNWDLKEGSYLNVRDTIIKEKPLLMMGETNMGKSARKQFTRSEIARHMELNNKPQ